MKKVWVLLVMSFLLQFGLPQTASAQTNRVVSYQEFYDALSPYGQWINDAKLGYVWIPNVNDDFRPYFTDGHWAVTEYGNTWVSDYPWGWACFHYGCWIYNDYFGWIWIPGKDWGPGWVAWRWGAGFCGWAPLYPGIDWAGDNYNCPQDWWVFLHTKYLYKPHYRNVWRSDFMDGPLHTQKMLQKTKFVTNVCETNKTRYFSGPFAAEVAQITCEKVVLYKSSWAAVRGADRISDNVVYIYRLAKTAAPLAGSSNPAPSDFMEPLRSVSSPDEITKNWNKPRPFKLDLQKHNPAFNYPFIRDNPPYFNYPRTQSMEED